MKECSKSITRRLSHAAFSTRYFVGLGVDIGGKPDPLALYTEFFPLVSNIRTWDLDDGDAQFMKGIADGTFDFVHSSHCLEHLVDPNEGLINWFRVLKEGGHLIVTVPDEDLYEQGVFPSEFNRDHKWTFTIYKPSSWCARSINVLDMVRALGPQADILKIELLNSTYRYRIPRYDQTLTPLAECGIEIIVRKRMADELTALGRRPPLEQPNALMRTHLNQYRDDRNTLKAANASTPPFNNSDPL